MVQAHITSFLNYIQYEKRYSAHTLLSYRNDLEQFRDFLKQNEDREIHQASHLSIRNWMVSLMEQKITPRSINRKISALKSFFKFLLRNNIVSKNPLTKVQTPKISKRLPVFVEQPAMDRLLIQMKFPEGFEGIRDKMILDLLYGTGMRQSELIHLRETDIDFYQSQIKVLGKGNKERIIPLHPQLQRSVHEYINKKKQHWDGATENFLLLDNRGRKMNPRFVYDIVKKYLSLITTIDKKSPHVLRHTFATHLMNQGADINAVKELLGHASLAATQVYTHNTIDKLKKIYKQAHPKA